MRKDYCILHIPVSTKWFLCLSVFIFFFLQSCSKAPDYDNLYEASMYGDVQSIKILLSMGAPVNAKNDAGQTPLHLAVTSLNVEACKLLIEHGANVNIANNDGNTPLHFGAPYKDICELLIVHGANVNAKNNKGWTPIFNVVYKYDNPDDCALLISKGANINEKDNSGRTPLDLAKAVNNQKVYDFLISKGAIGQNGISTNKKVNKATISRNKVISAFKAVGFEFVKGDQINGMANVVGKSSDGYSMIQILTSSDDIIEVSISGVIPDGSNDISDAHALYYLLMSQTILPQWEESANWIVKSKTRAFQVNNDSYEQAAFVGNFKVTIVFNKPLGIMMLSFHVQP